MNKEKTITASKNFDHDARTMDKPKAAKEETRSVNTLAMLETKQELKNAVMNCWFRNVFDRLLKK
ncbi:MAG TPA: hypothetical protein PLK94_09025 [Alphaproteobacteria bacterium]|nr:hypothetical protein [Alphaproteobacteria bacterium]